MTEQDSTFRWEDFEDVAAAQEELVAGIRESREQQAAVRDAE